MSEDKLVKEPVAPKKTTKVAKIITFYWRDRKNITFSVKTGKAEAPGDFYKTKNSVIRLDPKIDAKAIKYLKEHRDNEANGGNRFGQLKANIENTSEGATLDELMGLDKKTLASMVGGKFTDGLKSKGTLIAEILQKEE